LEEIEESKRLRREKNKETLRRLRENPVFRQNEREKNSARMRQKRSDESYRLLEQVTNTADHQVSE
jgi:uncharacterized membrane protein YgaE (UPF0421/DUF939 family)